MDGVMDGMTDGATTLPARHRLDVDAFHRMAEVGILPKDVRIELIDGELIEMFPADDRMPDGVGEPARYKLDADAFHRMAEVGIIAWGARIELIDGELIDMAPISRLHAGIVNRLNAALVLACQGRAIVSVQNPVRLDPGNEPQPDFAVMPFREDFYTEGEALAPADVMLLVEVSNSTLRYDRNVKLPLYARAGIAEYWIVNLRERVVEAYREPVGDRYGKDFIARPGERLALALDPAISIDLGFVLGR